MKLFFSAVIFLTAAACNSGSNNSSSGGDSTINIKPVDNVNGNVPDTTNSTSITGSKTDSSKIDSSLMKKKDSLHH